MPAADQTTSTQSLQKTYYDKDTIVDAVVHALDERANDIVRQSIVNLVNPKINSANLPGVDVDTLSALAHQCWMQAGSKNFASDKQVVARFAAQAQAFEKVRDAMMAGSYEGSKIVPIARAKVAPVRPLSLESDDDSGYNHEEVSARIRKLRGYVPPEEMPQFVLDIPEAFKARNALLEGFGADLDARKQDVKTAFLSLCETIDGKEVGHSWVQPVNYQKVMNWEHGNRNSRITHFLTALTEASGKENVDAATLEHYNEARSKAGVLRETLNAYSRRKSIVKECISVTEQSKGFYTPEELQPLKQAWKELIALANPDQIPDRFHVSCLCKEGMAVALQWGEGATNSAISKIRVAMREDPDFLQRHEAIDALDNFVGLLRDLKRPAPAQEVDDAQEADGNEEELFYSVTPASSDSESTKHVVRPTHIDYRPELSIVADGDETTDEIDVESSIRRSRPAGRPPTSDNTVRTSSRGFEGWQSRTGGREDSGLEEQSSASARSDVNAYRVMPRAATHVANVEQSRSIQTEAAQNLANRLNETFNQLDEHLVGKRSINLEGQLDINEVGDLAKMSPITFKQRLEEVRQGLNEKGLELLETLERLQKLSFRAYQENSRGAA